MHRGDGDPLLLIHGLGSSWRGWEPILDTLAAEREVIAVDLPGFGDTPPLDGATTVTALADVLERFISQHSLEGAAVVGSSVGARLALELARRGSTSPTVALDPGGFWNDRELKIFGASIGASISAVKALNGVMPTLSANPVTRTVLLAQFSSAPWKLPAGLVLQEMRSIAESPSSRDLLRALTAGPAQEGLPPGEAKEPITIGWGRHDRVTLARQAKRAIARFPDAELHWFEHSGHFPHWDQPAETARLILDRTGAGKTDLEPAETGTTNPKEKELT